MKQPRRKPDQHFEVFGFQDRQVVKETVCTECLDLDIPR